MRENDCKSVGIVRRAGPPSPSGRWPGTEPNQTWTAVGRAGWLAGTRLGLTLSLLVCHFTESAGSRLQIAGQRKLTGRICDFPGIMRTRLRSGGAACELGAVVTISIPGAGCNQ